MSHAILHALIAVCLLTGCSSAVSTTDADHEASRSAPPPASRAAHPQPRAAAFADSNLVLFDTTTGLVTSTALLPASPFRDVAFADSAVLSLTSDADGQAATLRQHTVADGFTTSDELGYVDAFGRVAASNHGPVLFTLSHDGGERWLLWGVSSEPAPAPRSLWRSAHRDFVALSEDGELWKAAVQADGLSLSTEDLGPSHADFDRARALWWHDAPISVSPHPAGLALTRDVDSALVRLPRPPKAVVQVLAVADQLVIITDEPAEMLALDVTWPSVTTTATAPLTGPLVSDQRLFERVAAAVGHRLLVADATAIHAFDVTSAGLERDDAFAGGHLRGPLAVRRRKGE